MTAGRSITASTRSPAGCIKPAGPAGRYLIDHGVTPGDFNSYGARRGNHEVMMRGTFANVRLRNLLVPGVAGGVTLHLPTASQLSIDDAAKLILSGGGMNTKLSAKGRGIQGERLNYQKTDNGGGGEAELVCELMEE